MAADGRMAKEPERLLPDTGWLPEPLRLLEETQAPEDVDTEAAVESLPDFLTGDDDNDEHSEIEAAHLIAAE